MNSGGYVVGERRKCFTCQSPITEVPPVGGDDIIKLFTLRFLLEVPAGVLEDNSGTETRNAVISARFNMIELCHQCCETIKKAKELYQQLKDVVQQFRDIQRRMVEAVRRHEKRKRKSDWKNYRSGAGNLIKFITTHDYQFTGSFVIRVEDFLEHQNAIKDEEDAEEIAFDELEADSICSEDSLQLKSEDENNDFSDRVNKLISSSSIVDGCDGEEMEDEKDDWGAPKEDSDPRSNSIYEEEEFKHLQPVTNKIPTESVSGRKRKLKLSTDSARKDEPIIVPLSVTDSYLEATPRGVTCRLCGIKDFGKVWGIKRHLREVHGIVQEAPPKKKQIYIPKTKPFPTSVCCELCGETVCTSELLDHCRDHVGDEYLYKCSNSSCPMVFPHAYAYAQHLVLFKQCQKFLPEDSDRKRTIEIGNGKRCDICGAAASSPRVLFAHLRRRHELRSRKDFHCPISECQEKFTKRQSLDIHILLNHDLSYKQKELNSQASQRCVVCSENMSVEVMENHLKEMHEAAEIIKCSQCPYLFSTRERLIEHLYEVHRYDDIPFVCDICQDAKPEEELTFPDHLKLREHYYEGHQIGQKYECELCEDKKVSWTHALFQGHMRSVHGISTIVCDICEGINQGSSVTFKTEDTLASHKIKVHGADPLKCKHCEKTYQSKSSLWNHVKLVHIEKDEGPYICEEPECNGKTFVSKKNLRIHQKTQHPKKYHKCPHCDREFPLNKKLTAHINSVHLGIRPYVCDICGEGFTTDKVLRTHKRIHTLERPHLCPLCGQGFRQSSALGRHLKSHKEKGDAFKPTGPMKHIRKRVQPKQ